MSPTIPSELSMAMQVCSPAVVASLLEGVSIRQQHSGCSSARSPPPRSASTARDKRDLSAETETAAGLKHRHQSILKPTLLF